MANPTSQPRMPSGACQKVVCLLTWLTASIIKYFFAGDYRYLENSILLAFSCSIWLKQFVLWTLLQLLQSRSFSFQGSWSVVQVFSFSTRAKPIISYHLYHLLSSLSQTCRLKVVWSICSCSVTVRSSSSNCV